MKKSLLTAMTILACVLTITSCSKKSDLIIGQWTTTDASYQMIDDDTKEAIPAGAVTFNFKDDNRCEFRCKLRNMERAADFTYEVKDNQLIFDGQAMDMPTLNKKNMVLNIKSQLYAINWYDQEGYGSAHLELERVK